MLIRILTYYLDYFRMTPDGLKSRRIPIAAPSRSIHKNSTLMGRHCSTIAANWEGTMLNQTTAVWGPVLTATVRGVELQCSAIATSSKADEVKAVYVMMPSLVRRLCAECRSEIQLRP